MPIHWVRRWQNGEPLSTSTRLNARVHDHKEDDRPLTRPMENQYSEEFAQFRAAVDKDPFAAVFGRRLESPPTTNNSSWTSLSWVFGPIKQDVAPAADPPNKPSASTGDNKASSEAVNIPVKTSSMKPPLETTSTSSVAAEEYEFDPISMKKVPKRSKAIEVNPTTPVMNPKAQIVETAEKKPFLQTLFAEHGAVDIPVKTFKPHKVHGYSNKDPKEASKEAQAAKEKERKSLESHQRERLRTQRARSLGNAVGPNDFCDKFHKETPPKAEETAKSEPLKAVETDKPLRKTAQPTEDNAPLFSGTTYASRSELTDEIRPAAKSDWLQKEGFRVHPLQVPEPQTSNSGRNVSARVNVQSSPAARIEPSLDRIAPKASKDALEKSSEQLAQNDQVEDLDLLRASDVRARAQGLRKTKQDSLVNKQARRQKLEADYVLRQQVSGDHKTGLPEGISSSKRLQEGLNNLWNRVKGQPQYVNLANTIKSMGVFQDAWKQYPQQASKDPNERLQFKDAALSKTPSIYRKVKRLPYQTNDAFTPSIEVVEAERASQARTAAVKAEIENAKDQEIEKQRQATELATEIRKAYETEYGAIDINHRQVGIGKQEKSPTTLPTQTSDAIAQQAPEETKSIKQETERLIEELKQNRRVLHEVSLQVRALRSRRPPTYWSQGMDSSPSGLRSIIAERLEEARKLKAAPVHNLTGAETAAQEISVYVKSVVETNRRSAESQAAEAFKAMRLNSVRAMERKAEEASKAMRSTSVQAVERKAEEASKAVRLKSVQAVERKAVESSEEALAANDAAKWRKAAEEQILESRRKSMNAQPESMSPEAVSERQQAGVAKTLPRMALPDRTAASAPKSTSPKTTPAMYKVLAYDSSTLQVTTATTTSSLAATVSGDGDLETPQNPTEVLARLNNPAKFMPYFQNLEEQGYEIVSGGGDILVFKKVRDAVVASAADTKNPSPMQDTLESLAGPERDAATVLDEIPATPAPAPTAPPVRPAKVKRQEDVFSGSGTKWHEEESQSSSSTGQASEGAWFRFRRGVRRVFFTGLATAGVAYTIGAVAENFGAQSPKYDEGHVRRPGRPGIYSTESSR